MIKLTIVQLLHFQTIPGFLEKLLVINFIKTLHSHLVMTEKFKESIDKSNAFGALLNDLSKAFTALITQI